MALPTGEGLVEAVIDGSIFDAGAHLMIQITPVTSPPFVGRVFYGTADAKVEFDCIATMGETDCLPLADSLGDRPWEDR